MKYQDFFVLKSSSFFIINCLTFAPPFYICKPKQQKVLAVQRKNYLPAVYKQKIQK